MVWRLSGLHALGQAIALRIEDGVGAEMVAEIEVELRNLDRSVTASDTVASLAGVLGGGSQISASELDQELSLIATACADRLTKGLAPLRQSFAERIGNSRQTFVSRATAAVIQHLEKYGELERWTYDPCGLRVLLRSSFQRHIRAVSKLGEECLLTAASEISALYGRAFDLGGIPLVLEPAPLPNPEPPVVLGQTIALDLRSSWWSRFWQRRKGYSSYTKDFACLIHEETQPLLDVLIENHAKQFEQALVHALNDFISANANIMLGIADDQAATSQTRRADLVAARGMQPARFVPTRARTPRYDQQKLETTK